MATAVLAAIATTATAQEHEIGSRVTKPPRTESVRPNSDSVIDTHLYAQCVVHRREAQAEQYLALTDPEAAKTGRENLGREIQCINGRDSSEFGYGQMFQIPTDLYRGMIAEALISARYEHAAIAALPLQRDYTSPWAAVSGRNAAVEEMGVCMAATNPDGIKAVLATHPESSEELAALRSLSPSMGPCLIANAKLTANRQSLRAALAEALYHRITTPSVPATPGKH